MQKLREIKETVAWFWKNARMEFAGLIYATILFLYSLFTAAPFIIILIFAIALAGLAKLNYDQYKIYKQNKK